MPFLSVLDNLLQMLVHFFKEVLIILQNTAQIWFEVSSPLNPMMTPPLTAGYAYL